MTPTRAMLTNVTMPVYTEHTMVGDVASTLNRILTSRTGTELGSEATHIQVSGDFGHKGLIQKGGGTRSELNWCPRASKAQSVARALMHAKTQRSANERREELSCIVLQLLRLTALLHETLHVLFQKILEP